MSTLTSSGVHSRVELLDLVAEAAQSGYLGLFVGSGFSRAATLDGAPSFEGLLAKVIEKLEIPCDLRSGKEFRLRSLPQAASILQAELGRHKKEPPARAAVRFRQAIADICNLAPDPGAKVRLSAALTRLGPSWVITTNYDLILETLLEQSISVLPNEPLVASRENVPIYHLHGHRLNPASIRITEEDYVGLVGPIDYQRLKLPLMLLESTTLMLGYAFGDINVRAAVEWSQSFKGARGLRPYPTQGLVIQALFKESDPKDEPHLGTNGEYILEIADLAVFLEELAERREKNAQVLASIRREIEDFLSDPGNAAALTEEGLQRDNFLSIVATALPLSRVPRLIEFLSKGLDPIWEKAREDMGFNFYTPYMDLLLAILERIDEKNCNPALLSYLADALERIGWYIDKDRLRGSAWEASSLWLTRHGRLKPSLKSELMSYSEANQKPGLKKMLDLAAEN